MKTFSSTDMTIIVVMVIAYILVTAWLSTRLRSKSSNEFLVASRTMPAFVVGVLMMSEFIGAKSSVGTAQGVFESGIAASWAVLSLAIAFPLFGIFLAKKLYNSGEFTISGAVAKRYGRSTQLIISLIMIYALLLVNLGNYLSGAAAISTVLHLSLPAAAFITAVVSTFYFAFGGLKSVAYVTVIHTAVKYLGVFIVLGVALSLTGGISPMVEKLPAYYFTWDGQIGPSKLIAWLIGNIGAVFCTQFIVQAISSTKSAEGARRSTYIAAALSIPFSIALGVIGLAAKFTYPDIKSIYALPVFLHEMGPALAGVVTISLVASVFVGVSTVSLAIASLVIKDFYIPMFKPDPQREFRATRLLSIAIGFVPLLLVFFAPGLLQLSFFTRALRLSISIVAMLAFYVPMFGNNRAASWGLGAAAVLTSVWYVLGDPFGIDNMYIALATPAVAMVLERVISKIAHADPAQSPKPNA